VRIASWNVNSIKARLDAALAWLDEGQPDVLALQELKCVEDVFPRLEFEAKGYKAVITGQKTYNGSAILSRLPIEDPLVGLPGDDSDEQARYVEATINGVRIASIYLPNGNPVGTEKFPYKIGWMKRLYARAAELAATGEPVALLGDYNVIPTDEDCYDPRAWDGDALTRPESRAEFRSILNLGYYDAFRAAKPNAPAAYTFWDYQAGAWQKDNGIRIDHVLLTGAALDRMTDIDIDRRPRGRPKASDHTPIWCDLADAPPTPRL
jgi:exodeoxyribonuclease III